MTMTTTKACTRENCSRPVYCKTLCANHYKVDYHRQWYLKNKDDKDSKNKAWYNANRAARLAHIEKKRRATPEGRWIRIVDRCARTTHQLEISREDFIKWADINRTCAYCGLVYDGSGSGVDRINSSIGYRIDNIATCCKRCNHAKNDQTVEEFKAHIERMYAHIKR